MIRTTYTTTYMTRIKIRDPNLNFKFEFEIQGFITLYFISSTKQVKIIQRKLKSL
jgi:hypothetical protein